MRKPLGDGVRTPTYLLTCLLICLQGHCYTYYDTVRTERFVSSKPKCTKIHIHVFQISALHHRPMCRKFSWGNAPEPPFWVWAVQCPSQIPPHTPLWNRWLASAIRLLLNRNQTDDCRSYPFLAVWILQIVNTSGIPVFTHTKEVSGAKAIFRHYDEVGEKSSWRLNHANLAVRHANQSTQQEHLVADYEVHRHWNN